MTEIREVCIRYPAPIAFLGAVILSVDQVDFYLSRHREKPGIKDVLVRTVRAERLGKDKYYQKDSLLRYKTRTGYSRYKTRTGYIRPYQ